LHEALEVDLGCGQIHGPHSPNLACVHPRVGRCRRADTHVLKKVKDWLALVQHTSAPAAGAMPAPTATAPAVNLTLGAPVAAAHEPDVRRRLEAVALDPAVDHQPTPQEVIEKIERLRRQRLTGKQIAAEAGVAPATVSRVLRRLGLNKLCALEPEPVRRYERENPGELIHVDIKKLGRIGSVGHRITGRQTGVVNRHLGIGWEFVHVCIDDASRIAFSRVMRDERKASAVAFLEAAVVYYASLGVTVERVMTDNGSCYLSRAFGQACNKLGLKHIKTKPYTSKTNGKAERFIQTSLREWAYAGSSGSICSRSAENYCSQRA
jgi:transposase InsO family protein